MSPWRSLSCDNNQLNAHYHTYYTATYQINTKNDIIDFEIKLLNIMWETVKWYKNNYSDSRIPQLKSRSHLIFTTFFFFFVQWLQCSVLQSLTKVRVCSFDGCNTAFYSSQCLIITPGHILITRDSNIQVSYTNTHSYQYQHMYMYLRQYSIV